MNKFGVVSWRSNFQSSEEAAVQVGDSKKRLKIVESEEFFRKN